MAALGLMARASLLPVAAFFLARDAGGGPVHGTLADAIESGSVAAATRRPGRPGIPAGHRPHPRFKAVLSVVRLVGNFSPIDSLSTGRSINWTELGEAFAQIVLLVGGIFAVAGICFSTAVNWPPRRGPNERARQKKSCSCCSPRPVFSSARSRKT